jgi:hypothetical protein
MKFAAVGIGGVIAQGLGDSLEKGSAIAGIERRGGRLQRRKVFVRQSQQWVSLPDRRSGSGGGWRPKSEPPTAYPDWPVRPPIPLVAEEMPRRYSGSRPVFAVQVTRLYTAKAFIPSPWVGVERCGGWASVRSSRKQRVGLKRERKLFLRRRAWCHSLANHAQLVHRFIGVACIAEITPKPVGKTRTRSRVTTGRAVFVEGDGNSRWARRYRDLIAAHCQDLGGVDVLSAAQLSLIRRASAIELELEQMEGKLSLGEPVDLDVFTRSASHLRRLFETLGGGEAKTVGGKSLDKASDAVSIFATSIDSPRTMRP